MDSGGAGEESKCRSFGSAEMRFAPNEHANGDSMLPTQHFCMSENAFTAEVLATQFRLLRMTGHF
jgi:hypothetical protein